MAQDLPQLSTTQPILQAIPVESKGEGYEAFAKTLASVAGTAEDQALKVEQDQSNAMFMQSAAQVDTVKTNAQIDMIKHPDQADRIAQNSAQTLDTITQNAFVNKQDRQKLKYMAAGDFNDLRMKAATTSYEQGQKSLAIQFWDTYPVTMRSIQSALDTGDFDKAQQLEESLHQTALNAAQIGAITPEQYATVRKSNYDLYDRAKDLMEMAKNPDGVNAAMYHAASASPFNSGTITNTNYPVDGNTQWTADHYNFDRTMAGQYSALYNDTPINWGAVAQASDNEYNNFKMQMLGVNQVRGAIHAGMPFAQIDARMTALNGQPKLSPMETGMVNYWKGFKNRIATGDGYMEMMTQTTLGGQYTQNYNQQSVAIQNSTKSPQEKLAAMRDNDNDYISKMATLGQAQHLDPSYIKPVPQQWTSEVQTAFNKDAPVAPAIQRIAYLKPENRAYLADAMKKPHQAVATFIAGQTMGLADTSFQAQLIEANQDRDYSALLKTGKNETKDVNIWGDISSNTQIKAINNYFAKLPGGVQVQNGFKTAAVNYVLYRAAKEGDINLNGKAQYEQDFVNNVAKGFNIVDGSRYSFNATNLDVRKADMDYLGDYAVSQAYKSVHQGRSEAEFQAYVDLNPLHATNTPDGRIVVLDQFGHAAVDLQGHAAFDQPYTSNMLYQAHANAEQTQKYMSQYFGFTENLQREARLHPGFPFVMQPDDMEKSQAQMQENAREIGRGVKKVGKKILSAVGIGNSEDK